MIINFEMDFHETIDFLKEIHNKLFQEEKLNKQDIEQLKVITGYNEWKFEDGIIGSYIDGMLKANSLFSVEANKVCKNEECKCFCETSSYRFQTRFNFCPYCGEKLEERR